MPDFVRRNRVGIAAYVYTIGVRGITYVLKISETKELIGGSIYWLRRLQSLDLPIPRVRSFNLEESPYYFVMSYIPGRDLCLVYDTLSYGQKKNIADELFRHQNTLRALPEATGYGFLDSYEDASNRRGSWKEVVECHLERSRNRIAQNGIFPESYVSRVSAFLPYFDDYFRTIRPEAFFDDATTKNVLISDGSLSGIIDLDWICFGDRLYAIALTTMSLLAIRADLDYAECLLRLEKPNPERERVFLFYVLVFCVDFMSERGMKFNRDEAEHADDGGKELLEGVFERYCEKLLTAIDVAYNQK